MIHRKYPEKRRFDPWYTDQHRKYPENIPINLENTQKNPWYTENTQKNAQKNADLTPNKPINIKNTQKNVPPCQSTMPENTQKIPTAHHANPPLDPCYTDQSKPHPHWNKPIEPIRANNNQREEREKEKERETRRTVEAWESGSQSEYNMYICFRILLQYNFKVRIVT